VATLSAPVVSPVFNRLLTASTIEEAFTATLKKWFFTYLREVERQNALPMMTFPTPVNYTSRNSFDAEKGEPIPKIVVISSGIRGTPRMTGYGQYRAIWTVGVGVAMGAPDEEEANLLTKGYIAAVKGIILQNKDLEGLEGVADIIWTDENYVDLPITNQVQQYRAGGVFFDVDIEDVVTARGGPDQPDQIAYDYGQVEEIFVDVEKVPVTEDVPNN
jgi:hypothetical protein